MGGRRHGGPHAPAHRAAGDERRGSVAGGSRHSAGPPTTHEMERTNPLSVADRHDVIIRLRQQVADGAYQPPVDELVNRLVSVVMARCAAEGVPRSRR